MSEGGIVIAGGGLAAAKTAEALRDKGFAGPITLIGDEQNRPYERPPLSKEYLTGSAERDSVFVHDESWYAEHDVELRLGVPVTAIDRAAHRVTLADGATVDYRKLVLATGSSPRTLPYDGLHYLRRIEDATWIKELLGSADRHLVVIGAGWIGLEVAAAARQAGLRVTVLESLELPLLRVLGPEIAQVFADLHTEHGVDLRLGVTVEDVSAGGTVVRLADGTQIEADAVVVGIGAAPNTQLAEDAGLTVDNGVVVDAGLRTSDPDIVAVGDIASARHPLLNQQVRVEHWANALNQPLVAAATLVGEDAGYDELPYFFTDQYDLGMEYVGLATPGDYDRVVVRGDLATREFIAFWLKDRRVLAGMNVNIWEVTDPIKALIRSGARVDPAALADPDRPLDQLGG
jgi:3-phenylpropionate/trans-cinnamate dioxygenase ferredoxin reductase component